jgi:hypothetical protein
MIYNFLTHEDLIAGIKEDMLNQVTGEVSSHIKKSEAAAVTYMKNFIGQRFLLIDCFPDIKEYSAQRQYSPSTAIDMTYEDEVGNKVTQSIIPPYKRDSNGIIVNYAYVNSTGLIYKCIADSTNENPQSTTLKWQEIDPRDALLVRMATDITLFYLHTRINPRKIPQLRTEMYNQAKEWLTGVKDHEMTPDLPKPIKPLDIDIPLWGSGPSTGHFF